MKRDMELIRRMLIKIEEYDGTPEAGELCGDGESEQAIEYHLHLLLDGGFIEVHRTGPMNLIPDLHQPVRLSWKGHEFLDDVRDDNVWKKTKETVGKTFSSVSLAVVQEVAKTQVKSLLSLS